MSYIFEDVTGSVGALSFKFNGQFALKNYNVEIVNGNRLKVVSTANEAFSLLEADVSEVEINGTVYSDPTAAQLALTSLVYSDAEPVVLTKEKYMQLAAAVQAADRGKINPATPIPSGGWLKGWYKPEINSDAPGTNYPNAGDLKAVKGFINHFYFDGSSWSSVPEIAGAAAQTFDRLDNVNPSTMKAAADRYDQLINNIKATIIIDREQFSVFSQITIVADNVPNRYYTLFDTLSENSLLKKITIKGKGIIDIYKIKPDGSQEEFLKEIDLGSVDEIHEISFTEQIIIEAGFLVGIGGKASGSSRFYFQVPKPSSQDFNLIQMPVFEFSNNIIIAYNYQLEIPGGTKIYLTPQDLEVNKKDKISTQLFKDEFLNNNNNWIAQGWTLNNGKYVSSGTGMNNNLFLPLIWNVDKRKARIKFTPSSNSDFRVHLLSNNSTKKGDGSSLFSVNFSENKIKIFKAATDYGDPNIATDGVLENSVLKEVAFAFNHVVGREYLIDLEIYETLHTITLYDTVTGEYKSLSFDGWAGGAQQQSYSFYVYSGGVVSINDFEILGVDNINVLFVGDSITAGVMVVDKSKRWWKLLQPKIKGVTAVSARGGHQQIDVINKFQNEILKLKPKKIVFLIGINSGGDQAQYTTLLNLCLNNNIRPIFCYQLAYNFTNSVNVNMLSVIPEQYLGYRFDLATSVNHDGVTCKTDLFYDGLHPIESGCAEMAKRFFDVEI